MQTSIDKSELIQKIIERLNGELQVLAASAKAAHEAATHEESRAEDQHDTRGIEAGYLAGAQAARAEEVQRMIQKLRELPLRSFGRDAEVASGALVEAKVDDKSMTYFLLPEGAAGWVIEVAGRKVQVITSRSPLGEELLGRRAGELTEIETARGVSEVEIVSVQ